MSKEKARRQALVSKVAENIAEKLMEGLDEFFDQHDSFSPQEEGIIRMEASGKMLVAHVAGFYTNKVKRREPIERLLENIRFKIFDLIM